MDKISSQIVSTSKKLLSNIPYLEELYGAVNDSVVILNKDRRIVFANKNLLKFLNIKASKSVIGLKLGEAMGCINAFKTSEGCGTTEFCSVCGAMNTILMGQKKKVNEGEARVLKGRDGEALDLLVKATPLKLDKEELTIFTIKDISHEKRRKALERIFFHDVLNTATYLKLASDSLAKNGKNNFDGIGKTILNGIEDLVRSINQQKILTEAESNELSVKPVSLSSRVIVEELLNHYVGYAIKNKVIIELDPKGKDILFKNDPNILMRVLENMVKNAIEASKPKDKVTIGVKKVKNNIFFWVHNNVFIPRVSQLQIFQRSFSTKEAGRGLGTYSMKFLSERYLKGKVIFDSSKDSGTTFTAIYPLAI